MDNDLSEEIPIIGSKGKPIILNFSSHQRLIRYNQIVVRIENFDAIYVSNNNNNFILLSLLVCLNGFSFSLIKVVSYENNEIIIKNYLNLA